MSLFSNLGLTNTLWQRVVIVLSFPILYWLGWIVYARFFHPLAKIPGPLWPSLSRTWLMWRMYRGDLEIHMRAIHERYKTCFVSGGPC